MIGNIAGKRIHYDRVLLLLQHFFNHQKNLITGIKIIDAMSTASFIAQQLFKDLPSYTRISICLNKCCHNSKIENNGIVISINSFNNCILLQDDIDDFFKSSNVKCAEDNCNNNRDVTINASSHLLIELTSIPQGNIL